jgi:hypothetical protein
VSVTDFQLSDAQEPSASFSLSSEPVALGAIVPDCAESNRTQDDEWAMGSSAEEGIVRGALIHEAGHR